MDQAYCCDLQEIWFGMGFWPVLFTFIRDVCWAFLKLTKMPCAVSGRRYAVEDASDMAPTYIRNVSGRRSEGRDSDSFGAWNVAVSSRPKVKKQRFLLGLRLRSRDFFKALNATTVQGLKPVRYYRCTGAWQCNGYDSYTRTRGRKRARKSTTYHLGSTDHHHHHHVLIIPASGT